MARQRLRVTTSFAIFAWNVGRVMLMKLEMVWSVVRYALQNFVADDRMLVAVCAAIAANVPRVVGMLSILILTPYARSIQMHTELLSRSGCLRSKWMSVCMICIVARRML